VPLDLDLLYGRAPDLEWRDIHWPAELAPDVAVATLRQLGTDQFIRVIALEIETHASQLSFRIGVPAGAAGRVEQLFRALVTDGALAVGTQRTALTNAWRISLTNRHRPLRTDDPEQVARAVLAAVTAAGTGERMVLQWLLGRTQAPRPVTATEPVLDEKWWRVLATGTAPLDADRRRALEAKRSDHAFACVGRVAIQAATPARTRALAVGVLAALRTAEAPGIGIKLINESNDKFNRGAVPWIWPQTLNVLELVGLLGWPLGDQPLPGIPRDGSRWLRPDPRIRPHRRVLGQSTAPGDDTRLGLSIDDSRQHLHVIGPTGTGKSTLLANLICQDIAAGRGVVVIEPKGDLIQDVLARIPPARVEDVVVLDPAETSRPIGLNPLLSRGRQPELVADQVLAVFHGLWTANWGPRLQDILHSALLTLASRGDASLCVLPALLTNPAIRRRLLADVDDPIALEPFWAWFEAISDAERQQAIAPVLNKLRPFLLRKSVRAIVGQLEPRFRIDEVFTKRKVVLVSLAKGLIGPEAAALLGSLFVAELWQAVLSRGAVAPERRHPVVVYADEFQDYVHLPTDMADALAQARGLGVGLTLAHQHLAQLPANLRAAVLANARSRVCFQLATDDAQTMARFSGGALEASDFQRLPRYEAYAQLVVGGEVAKFASTRTLPLSAGLSDPSTIRQRSRERYGRPVDEVEAELRRLIEGEPEDATTVGRRRRSSS
jgi:Type IV secretion-system coupling protein DNA-binding domain/TraM recognition site of TraD and TraG